MGFVWNQVLNINEDDYMGDREMEHILHRLLSAASNTELRQAMNVEDEYFTLQIYDSLFQSAKSFGEIFVVSTTMVEK